MASVREIADKVHAYLARPQRVSLEELEDWSAEYSWDIHKRADEQTRVLAYQIRAILNAHSDDPNEDGVRRGLAEAIRPFEDSASVYAPAVPLCLGPPSPSSVRAASAAPHLEWAYSLR